MAYLYKTVMKAENHTFDICQNRHNSRQTIILAYKKGENEEKYLGVIQNKTGDVVIMDKFNFKDSTIAKLREKLSK